MNATMDKREKVIAGLEQCANQCGCGECYKKDRKCPDDPARLECRFALMRDALELLKAQEAVKPEVGKADEGGYYSFWYVCGSCLTPIEIGDKYCHECGKAVAWDD